MATAKTHEYFHQGSYSTQRWRMRKGLCMEFSSPFPEVLRLLISKGVSAALGVP